MIGIQWMKGGWGLLTSGLECSENVVLSLQLQGGGEVPQLGLHGINLFSCTCAVLGPLMGPETVVTAVETRSKRKELRHG